MPRTTAEQAGALTGVPVCLDPLLQERNFGDLRGTPYSEIGFDMFEPDYAPLQRGELGRLPRPGRSGLGAGAGAAPRDRRAPGRRHHGLVCRSLAARHLTLPGGLDVPERWENTAVTIIEHARAVARGAAQLR